MKVSDKLVLFICGILAFAWFIYMVKAILLPFVVAIIVAYFLDPVVDKMVKWKFSRGLSSLVVISLFFVLVTAITILLVPIFSEQLVSFANKMPEYVQSFNQEYSPLLQGAMEKLGPDAFDNIKTSIGNVSGYIFDFLLNLLSGVWNSGVTVVNLLSLLFITPIVTFYLLRDWDKVVKKVESFLPRKYLKDITEQLSKIDQTLSGYIRGQTNVCLLLGAFYAIGLSIVGLEFGLFVGMATGILTFIPFVGILFGFVVGMIIAFFQFGDIVQISLVAAVFVAGQILEGNFLTPNLVGDKVGLHPVWIIFGMLAGGAMFGFVGILLAIPVTAVIGVLVRFFLEKYLQSAIYSQK